MSIGDTIAKLTAPGYVTNWKEQIAVNQMLIECIKNLVSSMESQGELIKLLSKRVNSLTEATMVRHVSN